MSISLQNFLSKIIVSAKNLKNTVSLRQNHFFKKNRFSLKNYDFRRKNLENIVSSRQKTIFLEKQIFAQK